MSEKKACCTPSREPTNGEAKTELAIDLPAATKPGHERMRRLDGGSFRMGVKPAAMGAFQLAAGKLLGKAKQPVPAE